MLVLRTEYARLIRLDLRSTGVSFSEFCFFASFSPIFFKSVWVGGISFSLYSYSFVYPTRVGEARANTMRAGF